jgi:uncharacterized protein (TIGR02996 family)
MTFRDDGFFHALQQDPDDNLLRLIYADYLEEHGDSAATARAELIRVQIGLAALASHDPRTADLTARQDELLALWEHVWLGDWADLLDGWAFHHGLVEAVHADASAFLDHAADWFALWPTLKVAKLTRAGGHLAALAASPWLAHLRGLDLSDNGIDSAALAHLSASRYVCLLQALDLSGNPIGPRGAMLLADARSADELNELHLARCELGGQGPAGEALVGLLGGRRSRQWRRLDLSGNSLCRRDLVRLVDSAVMPHLVALDLACNPLDTNGASVLAASPNTSGLVELGLCETRTGDAEFTELAHSPHLTSLRSLDLRGHHCAPRFDRQGVDHSGIGALSRSPLLARIRRLLLGPPGPSNGWTAEVLRIARPARAPSLVPDWWMVHELRKSRFLFPSQLIECDLEELWWLGDIGQRTRRPAP